MKRKSQQGVALVITLILLSVITFMAVTFLVVSRHEGEQVDTLGQQNSSRMAADGIEQMAVAQIIATMMGQNNGYNNQGLIVSTNFISPAGYYDPASGGALFNVAYNYANGQPLNQADLQAMLTNLLYLPRAPVFISTNKNQPNPEFRFYLDENGNGMFDTNGLVMNQDVNGRPILDVNNNPTFSVQVGDPEWVGFLEHPDQRHSASNFFLSRGAFIAIPIGNALDVNAIHNQSRLSAPAMASKPPEAYYRNQGVTSGELNLAAFLATLNANVWGPQTNNGGNGFYSYATDPNQTSTGAAFNDAAAILQYRNGGSVSALNSFQNLYGLGTVNSYLGQGAVDAYSVGPLMTGVNPPFVPINNVSWALSPWCGANNPVQLMRPRDLLTMIPNTSGNAANSFTNRLQTIGTALDTYDRYTFYRLLAQMGFSSAPEPKAYPVGGGGQPQAIQNVTTLPAGIGMGGRNQMSSGSPPEAYPYIHSPKMNLNFNNLTSTNFAPWQNATQFFTNAADRLLRAYCPTNFAMIMGNSAKPVVTNININFIPIYPVNFYTPGVHRLLQLAANMYDAGTNKDAAGFDYPSVFRPYFAVTNGSGGVPIIYIAGYTEAVPIGRALPPACLKAPLDIRRATDLNTLVNDSTPTNLIDNVYGVPYIVGARTNLPNFNQFSTAPVVQITRTLQLGRTNGVLYTNIAYAIAVSNATGLQCWNSYTNNYTRGVTILAADDFSMAISNTLLGPVISTNVIFGLQQPYTFANPAPISPFWPSGVNANGTINTASFALPMMTNAVGLAPGNYMTRTGGYTNFVVFMPFAKIPLTHSYLPEWGVNITNRLRVIIVDTVTERIIDYVQLGGLGQLTGLDSEDGLVTNMSLMNIPPGNDLWNTNVVGTNNPLPIGIYNQYLISAGFLSVPQSLWAASPGGSSPGSIQQAISAFQSFLTNQNNPGPQQMPFVVSTAFKKVYTWSANDPLVHYMVGDLTDLTKVGTNNPPVQLLTTNQMANILTNLNVFAPRYQPWNTVNTFSPLSNIKNAGQIPYRDPMIRRASDWLFPSNAYPNVGWLGRVHRGTPWQTVYLKSQPVDAATWQVWTGNTDPVDAARTQPGGDFALLDLFTTSPNDNSSRGQLSVNQTNAAAWAAVLDQVMVVSNSAKGPVATNIQVGQSNSFYGNFEQYLVSSINGQRAGLTNQGQVFNSIGQLLSTPALTMASPFINTNGAYYNDTNLTDAVFERIPQQVASLLRVGTPRYEIYAYGQSLKPADKSIVLSGASFGMPTNYQITGEVLTRTVVRFDNMPVGQPVLPGGVTNYALPILNASPLSYAIVTNVVPPLRAVVESYEILGPDQ